MSALSKPQLETLYRGFLDHGHWCAECLTIPDKRGVVVPFIPTPAQTRLFDAIKRQRDRGRPVRIVYLKPRRVHVSAAAATHLFHNVPFISNQHAFIVSYVKRSAQEIFDYIAHFQDHYQPYKGLIGKLPEVVSRNEDTGIKWANGSYIEIATAKNVDTGRSYSLRHLQLDEFAFWPNASKIMTALLPSVPKDPDTSVLIVSTANGVGGPFYEYWQRACDPQEHSEWLPLFFAWWEQPEYRMPLDVPAPEFQRSLSRNHPSFGDELAERQKYGLDLEQLAWRRWMITNECEGVLDKFRQEYPGEPTEAFISSGRPRFDSLALSRMPVVTDVVTGEVAIETVGTRDRVVFRARQDGHGPLTVYRRPDPQGEYVLGADPSEGRDVKSGEPGNSDPDYSVACVVDRRTGEQVAKYRARTQPAAFGEQVFALGKLYNWAYLVPEAKGAGLGTIEKLLELQYPLDRIFRRRPAADVQGGSLLQFYGYETSSVSRPQLISALDAAILDGSLIVRDVNTLQELRTFVVKPDGKAEHAEECHDDEVLALALAVIGLRTYPRTKPPLAEPVRPLVRKYGRRRYAREDD